MFVDSGGGAQGRCGTFRPVVSVLLCPTAGCSSTLLAFLGHSNKFYVFFGTRVSTTVGPKSSDWVYHVPPHGEFRRCKVPEESSLWKEYIMLHHLLYWTLENKTITDQDWDALDLSSMWKQQFSLQNKPLGLLFMERGPQPGVAELWWTHLTKHACWYGFSSTGYCRSDSLADPARQITAFCCACSRLMGFFWHY